MVECECGKQFKSVRGLNGHKRMHGPSDGSYSVDRHRKHPATYCCLQCNIESKWLVSKKNVFCSRRCQAAHEWKHVTKPSIEQGLKTVISLAPLTRYVVERDGPGCSCCGLTDWMGKPIIMDLDHIDGDRTNNFPKNLRLLCPNCHRQTPTWGNKTRN